MLFIGLETILLKLHTYKAIYQKAEKIPALFRNIQSSPHCKYL